MDKRMIKVLALIAACTTAITIGITHIDDYDENEVIEYLNESTTMQTQDYSQDEQPTEQIMIEEPSTEPSIANKDEDNCLVYATSNVNLRSSNSANSIKIGNLEIGESAIKILSCANNWDLVNVDGKLAYVSRDYIEYTAEQVEDGYEHNVKNDIVLTKTDLNFRSEPNAESQKIDTLDPNTELQVIANVGNDWLLVRHNGQIGYVSREYTTSLLEKAKSQYPNIDLDELIVNKVVYNASTKLNLRSSANTECEVIDELTQYETLRVLKENDEWYFVMTNDYNFGYVFKEYTSDLTGIFVDVDKSEQRLTLYNNNEVMLQTPVTTGNDSTPSDTGNFAIYSKERDRYLVGEGYRTFVEYWMPYNGGEGLHDASWRSVFGTESYKTNGSHGCVNMPPEIADDIYANVEVGTKVLVHK